MYHKIQVLRIKICEITHIFYYLPP